MELIPLRGRGAAENPANRFERLSYQPDPGERDPHDPGPRTVFYRDSSKSVLTKNDSPDVGFTYSVNPYRGCEHGCVYCLAGETPVLMADGGTRPLGELAVGDEVYGTAKDGGERRYVRTRLVAHWSTVKPAYRLTLADGTELVASGDHRFLSTHGWRYVSQASDGYPRRLHLDRGDALVGTGAFTGTAVETVDYRQGYLCGIVRADGLVARYSHGEDRSAGGDQWRFRLAHPDPEALSRARSFLESFRVATVEDGFARAVREGGPAMAIRAQARPAVERIERLIAWPPAAVPEWRRGFLAGLFDAEGSYSGGILRIGGTDAAIVACVTECLVRFGFAFQVSRAERGMSVRIRGGLREHLRFFHLTDPAIRRKRDIEGLAVRSSARLGVVSIEPVGTMPLFDITTGTGDFIANGVVSHNCYARPTHEWLGLSAGLDFETKIFVKQDAPELLRKALTSRRWEPQTIAISGITDCYQPGERKLKVTRGVLEVLAEFRNPVSIITKNHLVTRDVDLLAELASHRAAAVHLSVTTLDPELQRVMEPRTSTPQRRLDALRTLSEAGIPVGVMIAPVVPGLTDQEIPAILAAIREAGATSVGYVPLRLPYGLKEIFEQWLEMHFPDRKEKVLNRLRAMHGGKLYESRFGDRMRGQGEFAEQIDRLFQVAARKVGLNQRDGSKLSTAAFRRPDPHGQLGLF